MCGELFLSVASLTGSGCVHNDHAEVFHSLCGDFAQSVDHPAAGPLVDAFDPGGEAVERGGEEDGLQRLPAYGEGVPHSGGVYSEVDVEDLERASGSLTRD